MISSANLRLPMSTWEPLNLKNCELNGPLPIYRKLPVLRYFTRSLQKWNDIHTDYFHHIYILHRNYLLYKLYILHELFIIGQYINILNPQDFAKYSSPVRPNMLYTFTWHVCFKCCAYLMSCVGLWIICIFESQTLCICIHILCLSHKFACYLHITVKSTHVQMTLLPALFPKPQYCPLQDDLLHFTPA